MARRKRLNIHNTDKVFNLTIVQQYEQGNEVVVTLENIQEINEGIQDRLAKQGKLKSRDNTHYIVRYAENFTMDALSPLIQYGGSYTLETKKGVSEEYLPLLAENRKNGRVSFVLQDKYSFEQVQTIVRFSEVLTVSMVILLKAGEPKSGAIIRALSQLRYRIDKVELSFPTITKEEYRALSDRECLYELDNGLYVPTVDYKYHMFSELRNACSFWKMNLIMRAHSETEYEKLVELADVDKAVRKGNLTW